MPYVATSPADLLAHLSGIAHVAEDTLVIDDAARFRSEAAADLAWTAAFTADDATAEAARWLVWEGSQALGARSASIQELYMARSRGEVCGFSVPAMNLRAQTFDMARTIYETAAQAGRRRAHPRDRAQRADLHLPAPDGLRDLRVRGRHRGRLGRPGLRPGRPLPVQRQEVRRGPRGDDRGDPPRLPPRDRRRLPQHRHRQLHAGGPLQAEPRRGAEGELHPRRRAHGAHPLARGRRRHRQRRRRDRRGRQGQLDRRGAQGVPRRVRRGARPPRPRRQGPVQGLRPDRHQPRRRAAARRRRGRGQARLRRPRQAGRARPLARPGRRGPARRLHPAGRAVPQVPGGRDGRGPPRDGLPERALRAPGLPGRR